MALPQDKRCGHFIDVLEGVPVASSTDATDQMNIDPRTEAEALRAIRLGQQNFRRELLAFWGARCALTGLAIPELLKIGRASCRERV